LHDDSRGRKKVKPLQEENERLQRRVARLEYRLQQAETIIEVQKKCRNLGESSKRAGERHGGLMEAAQELIEVTGVSWACRSLGIGRVSFYRFLSPLADSPAPRKEYRPARSLSVSERQQVLEVLHADRFVDQPPGEVYAALLDEEVYLCSVRTMYRILEAEGEVRERRDQARHPHYAKPELLATQPNQLWSWDITKLWGPAQWTYYYLYVILDVFSRYVVGWMVAHR